MGCGASSSHAIEQPAISAGVVLVPETGKVQQHAAPLEIEITPLGSPPGPAPGEVGPGAEPGNSDAAEDEGARDRAALKIQALHRCFCAGRNAAAAQPWHWEVSEFTFACAGKRARGRR